MKSYQYDGEYLQQFNESDRSLVANQFCYSFREWREGAPAPEELLRATCARVLRAYREGDPRADLLEAVYHSLSSDEALKFAAFIVWRESLSPGERARLKRESGEAYKQKYLEAQQPTPRQLSFLRSLGSEVTPENRAAASKMIDALIKAKSANQAA